MYTSGRQPRRLTGLFLVFATIFGTSTISAQDNSFDGGVLGGIVGGIIAPNFPAARIRSCGLDAGQPCLRTDQITTLQSSLSVLGFDPGPVDGIIGPNTLQAVDQFRLLAGSSRKGFYPSQIEFNWVISVAEVLEGESQPSHEKIQSAARNYAMQGNTSSEDAFDYGMDSIVREDPIAQLRFDFDNLETGSVNDLDSLVQLPYDSGVGSVIQVDSVEQLQKSAVAQTPVPTRAFAGPSQFPPTGFRGYGFVAFPARASDFDLERHKIICQAYLTSLPTISNVRRSYKDQFVTVWPVIDSVEAAQLNQVSLRAEAASACERAINSYDDNRARDVIDMVRQTDTRALEGRGPFLFGWIPADGFGEAGKLILMLDLSRVTTYEQALTQLQSWQQQVETNPELLRDGFSPENLRRLIRDWADLNGEAFLVLIGRS